MDRLTHVDAKGRARMVDVGGKKPTRRTAVARGRVRVGPKILALLRENGLPKGDLFATAQIAGIQAAKRTHELIPLCHPLKITHVEVNLRVLGPDGIEVTAAVRAEDKTGVEMEALTAAAVACLTVYDMCKAVDKGITIEEIRLLKKTGGKSGTYERR
jgi:cyclic pyranopterin phosphate synthase